MKYLWYSGATDVTGEALMNRLGIMGGKDKPIFLVENSIFIGWGCKTSEPVEFGPNVTVINHPDAIRGNRNKLGTLYELQKDANIKQSVADVFVPDELTDAKITQNLPLIGRTKYHQGGKGFWFCHTVSTVKAAIEEGAQYFQKVIDIADEYRLHIFDGRVIYAQKKVPNPGEAAWTAQRVEKVQNAADKAGVNLDENTMRFVLGRMFKEAKLPDRIIRSNTRGWMFSSIRTNEVNVGLATMAKEAVSIIGLNFAAVDCALDSNGKPWFIEANTGPGLMGSSLNAYVNAFENKIAKIERVAAEIERVRAVNDVNIVNVVNAVNDAYAAAAPAAVGGARRPARAANGRFRRANAENNEAQNAGNIPNVNDNGVGVARVLANVQNDAEARAVIDALMRGAL